MWPSVFGPGWGWGILVALAFLCLILGLLGFLFLIFSRQPPKTTDAFDGIWHRFEEGDLAREEFERLRSERRRAYRPGAGGG